MAANALREEAILALWRLGDEVAAAAVNDNGDDRGHWDDGAAAKGIPVRGRTLRVHLNRTF